MFSFVDGMFLIRSSLPWMIPSNWSKTKFKFLNIPTKILTFHCQTQYTIAAKPSLQEQFLKVLPFQVTVVDANLVITWSRNPHANTPIPGKPSKIGLIEVWHKDNLYLGTNTIENEKTPTQWILIREREVLGWHHEASCSSISSFLFFREPRKGDYPTNTQVWQRSLFIWKLRNLTCLVMPLFILTRLKKTLIDPP
jgi:hypothetical protein